MRRIHRRAVYLIGDDRTIRSVAVIDADEHDDISLSPISDALRELRS